MLLKNSSGTKSASFTMMVIAFAVVTLWLLVSIVAKVGGLEIRPFSGSEAMSYLTPILALYWGRKWQEGKTEAEKPAEETPATSEEAK